jgi:hypothetical protein
MLLFIGPVLKGTLSMNKVGMAAGDQWHVHVKRDARTLCTCRIKVSDDFTAESSLYMIDDEDLISVREALMAVVGVIDFKLEKPRLQRLLRERIAQLKSREDQLEEELPPSPTADSDTFPF